MVEKDEMLVLISLIFFGDGNFGQSFFENTILLPPRIILKSYKKKPCFLVRFFIKNVWNHFEINFLTSSVKIGQQVLILT